MPTLIRAAARLAVVLSPMPPLFWRTVAAHSLADEPVTPPKLAGVGVRIAGLREPLISAVMLGAVVVVAGLALATADAPRHAGPRTADAPPGRPQPLVAPVAKLASADRQAEA